MTENSSTPRQGNAEDRADYSSFSEQLGGTHYHNFGGYGSVGFWSSAD